MLSRTDVASRAIPDEELFRHVCRTKQTWFRSGFSDYDELVRDRITVVPRGKLRNAFIRDYRAMRPMFFVEPPSIDALLAELADLESRIRQGV